MELDGNQPLKCEYWWLSEVSLQKEDCAKNHNYLKKNYGSNSSLTQGTINLKSSEEIIDVSVNEGTAFLTGMSSRFLSSQKRIEQNKIDYDFAWQKGREKIMTVRHPWESSFFLSSLDLPSSRNPPALYLAGTCPGVPTWQSHLGIPAIPPAQVCQGLLSCSASCEQPTRGEKGALCLLIPFCIRNLNI